MAVIWTMLYKFLSQLPSLIHPPAPLHSILKFAHVNVQSRKNNFVQIHDFITDNESGLLFATKTWLYDQGDEAYITDMTPDSYQFHSFPRCGRRGGGIGLVSKCSLKSKSVKRLNYQRFEAVEAKLFHSGKSMSFVCLYRPPAELTSSLTKCFRMSSLVSLITWQVGHVSQ